MARGVVILDYGHGGVFNGAYQTSGKQYTFNHQQPEVWIGEGLVNRCIAARLANMLNRAGVRVYDCVANRWVDSTVTWMELEQLDVPLSMRAAVVNALQKTDKTIPLVSIHANALSSTSSGPGQSRGGVSLWTSPGETMSDGLADDLYWGLTAYDMHGFAVNRDMSDGDVDYEADFHLLTRTVGVAVLIESGFFDNWDDARRLMSRAGQRMLAHSYLEGIMRYLKRTRAQGGDDGL
jgi:N-acetylmuramoyl-L-alanine amidase